MNRLTRSVAALGLTAVSALACTTAARGDDPLLASATACTGQSDAQASVRVQAGAARCLINQARVRLGAPALRGNRWLAVSARAKSARIVACQDFSHRPCGASLGEGLDRRRYRVAEMGEVIYVGGPGLGTARSAVAAWLASPSHRRSLLNGRFRDIGVGLSAPVSFEGAPSAVWTVDLGRRR